MRQLVIALFLMTLGSSVWAELSFATDPVGDHFYYEPEELSGDVLVLAHGTRPKSMPAKEWARTNLDPWLAFAEDHGVLLIAPVFDDARFGNLSGGFGGYRSLFGKHMAADLFVTKLVQIHSARLQITERPFLIYGHSAGGQFAARFAVQHPGLVARVITSAPGRFSYPTLEVRWPYGAKQLARTIEWVDGSQQEVRISPNLRRYARAAGKIHVIVGAQDLAPQPQRPAHEGRTRVDLARSWVQAMNQNAKRFGRVEQVQLSVLPGLGHNYAPLAQAGQALLGLYLER